MCVRACVRLCLSVCVCVCVCACVTGAGARRGHVVDQVFECGSHCNEGVVHGRIFLVRHAVVEDRAAVADVEDGDHQEAHHTHGPRDQGRERYGPQRRRLLRRH